MTSQSQTENVECYRTRVNARSQNDLVLRITFAHSNCRQSIGDLRKGSNAKLETEDRLSTWIKCDEVSWIQAGRSIVHFNEEVARVVDEEVGRRLHLERSDVCNHRTISVSVAIASETSLVSKQWR